jgi:hypothetical protein
MLLKANTARVWANSFLTGLTPATTPTGIIKVTGYTLAWPQIAGSRD